MDPHILVQKGVQIQKTAPPWMKRGGVGPITQAFNFYRHRDGSLHVLKSTPKGYNASGMKETKRQTVTLDDACNRYYLMYNEGRAKQLRSNPTSAKGIFQIPEFKKVMEETPGFTGLLAIEML